MQYRHRRLQRSVTETRTLPSGRLKRSAITQASSHRFPGVVDPGARAVRVHFFLPYRQASLDFLDHIAARRKRPVAMRRGRDDRDARLTDRDRAEAMPEHHTRL